MPLIMTSNPLPTADGKFKITEEAQMPEITVTVAPQGGGRLPERAIFEWSATLEFNSNEALYGGRRNTRHPDIAPQTGPNSSWRIPFTKVSGGTLTVQVVMRAGGRSERANKEWKIIGCKLEAADIRTFANSIGANRAAFRKLMKQESELQQFLPPSYWPNYSSDRRGGVGLCQLTNPPPTDDQTWSWKDNVRGGWAVYLAKEREARGYPRRVQNRDDFRNLVEAWNRRTRPGQPPLPVDLPPFTTDELMRETLRRFNGGPEHRPRQVNGLLAVTLNAEGTRGEAEWEAIPVAERTGPGDHNYVENVLSQPDY